MNRTQRRQQERQNIKTNTTYTYTPSQLRAEIDRRVLEFYKDVRMEATREVVNAMLGIVALSLNSQFQFGHKRIGRVLENMKETFMCIQNKHVSLDDILKECLRIKVDIPKMTKLKQQEVS